MSCISNQHLGKGHKCLPLGSSWAHLQFGEEGFLPGKETARLIARASSTFVGFVST